MLILGFAAIIIIGSLLLALPISAAPGTEIRYVDALFTSVSAVCVTGLIVKDTSADFSLFGQSVILFLIQIGGLGYMTSATILFLIVGKRIGLRERVVMQEALNIYTMSGVVKFARNIFFVTIFFEAIGAVLLTISFAADHGPARSVWLGVFHSISAFNNAGFTLFSHNLMGYESNMLINLTVMMLILAGGVGFFIFSDLYKRARKETVRLTVHTKITLLVTAMLICFGALFLFVFEQANHSTVGALSAGEKVMASFFHSITRTAGFNTVDTAGFVLPSLMLLMFLMFVGGSSGSASGGIKAGTFGIIIISLWSTLRGRTDAAAFHKRLPPELISRAFFLTSLFMALIVLLNMALLLLERTDFLPTLFEVVSAAGTVGLSLGDGGNRSMSALFSDGGKIIIIIAMFIGRLGPLTIGVATLQSGEAERIRYPDAKILIG